MIEMKRNYDQPTPSVPTAILYRQVNMLLSSSSTLNFRKWCHVNYNIQNLVRSPSFCSLHIMFILQPRNRVRPVKGHKPTSYQGSSAYNKNLTRKKMN